jgi:hypothetical protein
MIRNSVAARIAGVLALLCAAAFFSTSTASATSASAALAAKPAPSGPSAQTAIGYAGIGSFCYSFGGRNICAPRATLGHFIQGDGRRISRQEASVDDFIGAGTAGGWYCNWRIAWQYYDTNNRLYQTVPGPLHTTCDGDTGPIGRADRSGRTLPHFGRACAQFLVNGVQRGRQCHNITE